MNLPGGAWGCGGGRTDQVQTLTQQRADTVPWSKPASTIRRWATSSTPPDSRGASTRASIKARRAATAASGRAYQAVKHIYNGPDWKNDVITPQTQFLTDVPEGKLANFTWITPICANSDHVNCGGGYGPSWVASLVNTIGESKFWNSTAIFVMWDDWGGLYDHVPPPFRITTASASACR